MSHTRETRRDFLADAGRVAAGAALGLSGCFPSVGGRWAQVAESCRDEDGAGPIEGASRVVEIHREDSVLETVNPTTGARTLAIQPESVTSMLASALAALTGSAERPWTALLPDYSPTTRIGIKVNCLNDQLPTSVPLVKALVQSLRAELDVGPERVIVWDRRLDELQPAPPRRLFEEEDLGALVMGTVSSTTDGRGPGYGDAACGIVEGKTPRLSRILTDLTDVTINCPVLKTHGVSGITAALKNIYGIIDNPGDYHKNIATALPALYRLPPIRTRIRLHVVDALFAVTAGGTSDPPDASPRRILAAVDPLALDNYALALVNTLRAERRPPLGPVDPTRTTWLENGFNLGLGTLQSSPIVG